MRPTPNDAAPTYRAMFGPGGGYFREDGSEVTDPAEKRRAWGQIKRLMEAPLIPRSGEDPFKNRTPDEIRQMAEEYQPRSWHYQPR